jgi:hypothetical protein
MTDACDARIRPFAGDTEVRCQRNDAHTEHDGNLRDYAWPGSVSTIHWQDDDRRTFYGEWPGRCGLGGCVLPANHPGDHAP